MDPEQLSLAPGVRAVALGRRLVQVGLEHTRAVRLTRTPATERLLTALATGARLPDDPEARAVAAELLDRGLAVPGMDSSVTRVAVVGRAGSDPVPLLESAGLACTTDADEADVVLLAAEGELDRELLVPLLRAQQPHLPVRLVDGVGLVGPFSVPGQSACLGCVDLHRTADDAAHLLLVDRYAHAAATAPAPIGPDVVLGTLATAWAVRDLVTWSSGGCPSTWSRTVRLEPGEGEVSAQAWWRHPECGCTWGQGPSATMGA
ncbi:MAG TPA: hypothetical protein VI452_15715 [Marmoricola sp.]